MHFDLVSDSLSLDVAAELSLCQDNRSTASQIREIIRGLVNLGANINPSSRLHQYAQMFEHDDDSGSLSFDFALLESLQFLAIYRALSTMSDPSPWLPIVSSSVCGQTFAGDDRADSRARSDQFELFTMACLTMGGFQVMPKEPDLRAHIEREEVAFAAKRLRSIPKLRRNLHGACAQLAKHKIPGFAVIDLSFVELVPKPVYVRRLEQQQVIAAVLLDGFAKQHEREILSAIQRPSVQGILFHASVVGRSVQPLARFVSRRWLLCASTDTKTSRQLIATFQSLGQPPKPIFSQTKKMRHPLTDGNH